MLLEDFQGNQVFNLKDTGMPTPNDILFKNPEYFRETKKVEGRVIWMSPQQYIDNCKRGFKSITKGWVDNLEATRHKELVDEYEQNMKDGDIFPLVMLDYRRSGYDKTPDFNQEGLHRAMAARNLKITKIPVAVLKSVGDEPYVIS